MKHNEILSWLILRLNASRKKLVCYFDIQKVNHSLHVSYILNILILQLLYFRLWLFLMFLWFKTFWNIVLFFLHYLHVQGMKIKQQAEQKFNIMSLTHLSMSWKSLFYFPIPSKIHYHLLIENCLKQCSKLPWYSWEKITKKGL